jgi:hypothetical protein
MSGVGDVVCAKQKPPSNNVSTGFLDHFLLDHVVIDANGLID